MSTGISISCINRIKELAEEKKFAEALEILDTQNLEKSINPQFLRISGEIFRENKRYYDSRYILLKAHQMSPQGTRIIFELMQLYLELGYFTLAKKYYEQYQFYSTKDDVQKDYVEYTMKKATNEDVKELAAILIPILERMPEDKWNFEAVLLYDKLGRKDKALEECRYILENFKESSYVQPVIDYIDDKLDVDTYFYKYPKEEQNEDTTLFKDLAVKEEKMLEADHLRMYPPEARIMVEAEDNEALDVKPVKEKKPKKKRKRKEKTSEEDTTNTEETNEEVFQNEKMSDIQDTKSGEKTKETKAEVPLKEKGEKQKDLDVKQEDLNAESEESTSENAEMNDETETSSNEPEVEVSEEELIRQQRQAALEKLLAKKIDTEKVKQSAKNLAKTVKGFDTDKTKQQVKNVAETVRDNVKKATEVIGEAVGAKTQEEVLEGALTERNETSEEIVDGIIESILEPPKKPIGQVVVNEELDALIPESLEAMTAEEIAELEVKKKEAERLELEALENQLKLEEEKKNQKLSVKTESEDEDETNRQATVETTENELKENISIEVPEHESEVLEDKSSNLDEYVISETIEQRPITSVDSDTFNRLKEQFLADMQDEDKPLDSLGFISVVQSDVDASIEDAMPDEANMLHQMIDNKEFYSGEDSTKFESNVSYENHGFDIEDYDFDSYLNMDDNIVEDVNSAEESQEMVEESISAIEVIYADEEVIDFDEIIPKQVEVADTEEVMEQLEIDVSEEKIEQPKTGVFLDESEVDIREEIIEELEESAPVEEFETVAENEEVITDEDSDIRNQMRVRIVLSDYMVRKLLELKESR